MSSSTHVLLVQLGKRVQSLRKDKGWTQTDLAVHLDMNRGHISDVEQGEREVGVITLQRLLSGFPNRPRSAEIEKPTGGGVRLS